MEDFDIDSVKKFLQEKHQKRQNKLHKLFLQAWIDFEKITKLIIEKYNPEKIYQWGSLLNEKYFSEISDIDIALQGIKSSEEFFKILGDSILLTNFPLHIIEVEKIEKIYASDIIQKGRLVYERKNT